MLLRVGLKAKRRNFSDLASKFAQVSSEAICVVADRVESSDHITANSVEETRVLELMKQVNAVSSYVPGSSASKVVQRPELKALMIDQGLPSFYLTINPSDVHNPLVRFLAGADIQCFPVITTHLHKASSYRKIPSQQPNSLIYTCVPFLMLSFVTVPTSRSGALVYLAK